MRRLLPGLLALLASAVLSLLAYPRLPARVPTHWNASGTPDGWGSPLVAVLMMPAVMLVMAGVFLVLPRIDPKREAYQTARNPYWLLVNAVLVFLAVVHVMVVGSGLGWGIPVWVVMPLGVGALFVLIGLVMARIPPNWFMGIRTPWTLSDDAVWTRTHRVGGWAFVGSGVVIAGMAVVREPPGSWILLALAAAGPLATLVYSYVVWRRRGP